MKRRHLLLIIECLILIMLCLSGCNAGTIDKIKENSAAVKEYNDAIQIYNRIALSFTSLAREIHKEFEEKDAFDQRFWSDCNDSREKVLDNISNMKEFEFKYEDIEKVMDRINPMLNDIEIFLGKLEEFRELRQYSDWKDFKESNDMLYQKILSQSNEISKVFDIIYDEFIIKEKE